MPDQTPVQIAWVTHDLDATEKALTGLMGAKKWVRMPDVTFGPDACTHRGRPADFTADISLSYAGDTQLEVIAPVRGESVYSDFLTTAGPGLHHVCLEAPDVATFDAMLRNADGQGTPVVCQSIMPGGMRFAYLSAADAGIPYLEIAHIPSEIRAFFDYVKQEQR
jgi:catechol 2,3-dioxygenase-like lactoylglutathione lyase family enzyme